MIASVVSSLRKTKIGLSGKFLAFLLLAVFVLATPQDAEARRYASIVIDYETGTVLHSENPNREVYPASLTKMMTLYLLFEAIEAGRMTMDTDLPVSQRAAGQPPSKLGLRSGGTIKVSDAILALAVKSANDVATVVAEALGGTEWAFAREMMTPKAHQLGMSRTDFRNASGLPDNNQVTTARDMATLSVALIRDFPQYYHYFSVEQFSYNGRAYGSHNNLLDDYQGADGIKTGYIRASGFNLAASVRRNGRRVIAIVFGGRTANSRDRHIAGLLDEALPRAYALAPAEPLNPGERNPFRSTQYAAAAPASDADPDAGTLTIDYSADPQRGGCRSPRRAGRLFHSGRRICRPSPGQGHGAARSRCRRRSRAARPGRDAAVTGGRRAALPRTSC